MSQNKHYPKITVGCVLLNYEHYLDQTLPTILNQDYPNLEFIFRDNGSTDGTIEKMEKDYPQIKLIKGKNIGFGAGHNQLIHFARGEFYFCSNIDILYQSDFLSKLITSFKKGNKIAVATGKIRIWDFKNNQKTNLIDSVGLDHNKYYQFFEKGHKQEDQKQFNQSKAIWGASGTALLFKKELMNKIAAYKPNGAYLQYFDEIMFAYKEDIDLAHRLNQAGLKYHYNHQAVAYHDRAVGGKSFTLRIDKILAKRKSRNPKIKEYSFLNDLILMARIKKTLPWPKKFWIYFRQIGEFFYVLLLERKLLKLYKRFWKLRGRI